jgi:hypothetical protein
MGYALWIDSGLAWAQGTHEYRPAGAAVISATDLFRLRDFSAKRRCPHLPEESYQGLFASIVDLNDRLRKLRGTALVGLPREVPRRSVLPGLARPELPRCSAAEPACYEPE